MIMSYYEANIWCNKCGTNNRDTKLTWVNDHDKYSNDVSVITLRCKGRCNRVLISYGVYKHIHSSEEAIDALPTYLRII